MSYGAKNTIPFFKHLADQNGFCKVKAILPQKFSAGEIISKLHLYQVTPFPRLKETATESNTIASLAEACTTADSSSVISCTAIFGNVLVFRQCKRIYCQVTLT